MSNKKATLEDLVRFSEKANWIISSLLENSDFDAALSFAKDLEKDFPDLREFLREKVETDDWSASDISVDQEK